MQSSTAGHGSAQKAVDGSTSQFFQSSTCTLTDVEHSPWWYVNLLEPYLVQIVRIDFGAACCGNSANRQKATVAVRVGNNRPDLGTNPLCNRYTGFIEEGKPLFLPCTRPAPGAFVSIHLESPSGSPLSICETFIYTDHALSIEQCPSFRDQPLGSTATYNGKCYLFHNNQALNFDGARKYCESRGGSLVDETSPALQGFLSWELYRRHRNDQLMGQYWLGAVRDQRNSANWKWINGRDVQISFWNSLTNFGNCSRFDGAKGWLWSDTDCQSQLNFICQYRPLSCGKPEKPTNSTLITKNMDNGTIIEYQCAPGSLLMGPKSRACLPTGFFSEFAPKCKYLDCDFPASISNGGYRLLNGTTSYQSIVNYNCQQGYAIVGKSTLACDVDERWNGPPPSCEPLLCSAPIPPSNGYVTVTSNVTMAGTKATFDCRFGYELVGDRLLTCLPTGSWDNSFPFCRADKKLLIQSAHLADGQQSSRLRPPQTKPVPAPAPASVSAPAQFVPTRTGSSTPQPSLLVSTSSLAVSPATSTSPSTIPALITTAPGATQSTTTINLASTAVSNSLPASLNGLAGQLSPVAPINRPSVDQAGDLALRRQNVAQSSSVTQYASPPTPQSHSPPALSSEQFNSAVMTQQSSTLVPQQATTGSTLASGSSDGGSSSSSSSRPSESQMKTGPQLFDTSHSASAAPIQSLFPSSSSPPAIAPVVVTVPSATSVAAPPTTTGAAAGASGAYHHHRGPPPGHSGNVLASLQPPVRQAAHNSIANARFSLDGIIAVAIFGGFIFLGAIITIIVIIIRRKSSHSSSIDAQTISTYESHADHNGLYRNYQQAWENLRYAGPKSAGGVNHNGLISAAHLGQVHNGVGLKNFAAPIAVGGHHNLAMSGSTASSQSSTSSCGDINGDPLIKHHNLSHQHMIQQQQQLHRHHESRRRLSDELNRCASGGGHNDNDDDDDDDDDDSCDGRPVLNNIVVDDGDSTPINSPEVASDATEQDMNSGERETGELTVNAAIASARMRHHSSSNSIGRRSGRQSHGHHNHNHNHGHHYHHHHHHHHSRNLSGSQGSNQHQRLVSSSSPSDSTRSSNDDLDKLAYGHDWQTVANASSSGGQLPRHSSSGSHHGNHSTGNDSSSNEQSASSGTSILRSNLRYN